MIILSIRSIRVHCLFPILFSVLNLLCNLHVPYQRLVVRTFADVFTANQIAVSMFVLHKVTERVERVGIDGKRQTDGHVAPIVNLGIVHRHTIFLPYQFSCVINTRSLSLWNITKPYIHGSVLRWFAVIAVGVYSVVLVASVP